MHVVEGELKINSCWVPEGILVTLFSGKTECGITPVHEGLLKILSQELIFLSLARVPYFNKNTYPKSD